MNRKLKKSIKMAFQLPEPPKKQEFIDRYEIYKKNSFKFFINQIQFIRKRVWLIEALAVVLCLLIMLSNNIDESNIKYLSAFSTFVPFFVLLIFTEIARSISYNMAELEMTTRFSFSYIVIARMIILSVVNMLCALLIIFALNKRIDYGIIRIGLYIFVPLLASSFCILFTLNHIRNKNIIYCCTIVCATLSMTNFLITQIYKVIYTFTYTQFWVLAFITIIAGLIFELIKLIKNMEELHWNLR